MRTIREHWEDYDKLCLPEEWGTEQRNAARACFYTGAQVVLSIIWSMPAPEWSNEARVAVVEGLQAEIYALVGRTPPEPENAGHS